MSKRSEIKLYICFAIVLVAIVAFSGCAVLPEDDADCPDDACVEAVSERDDKRVIYAEAWRLCELSAKRANSPTHHKGHVHEKWHREPSAREAYRTNRDDLFQNGCHSLVKKVRDGR